MNSIEYIEKQKEESKRLVAELKKLEAAYPKVKAEYDHIDAECISIARDYRAAFDAGSPRAIEIEIALKKRRWLRDGAIDAFRRKRDALIRQIQAINRPYISSFHEFSLDAAQGLARRYSFEWIERRFNMFSERNPYLVKVRHNIAACEKTKDRIFEILKAVRELETAELSEVLKAIARYRAETASFDLSTMEVEEVSESKAREMRPRSESILNSYDKLDSLNARVSAMEAQRP